MRRYVFFIAMVIGRAVWGQVISHTDAMIGMKVVSEEKGGGVVSRVVLTPELSPVAIPTCRDCIPKFGFDKSNPYNKVLAQPFITDTAILWVDRNHLNAIANEVTISGDGMWIFANWQLNNERVGLYHSTGNEIPVWKYDNLESNSFCGIGISHNGDALGAGYNGTYEWSRASSSLRWFSGLGGKAVCMSHDGSKIASACEEDSFNIVYVFDTNTGDTLWSASFINSHPILGLDMSTDGSIVAATTYDTCFVFENGVQRGDALSFTGTQYSSKLSGDGLRLITGDYRGKLRFYEWNGINYEFQWAYQYPSGTYYNWICGRAISRDGSTILIGTLDFGDGSDYTNSCAICFDASSPTPEWMCHRYGDMVQACALSADGSYGIVGSWGMLGATYGDVVSLFNTLDSVPIFSILDDTDEPGSIFSVGISDSGNYATAGGKAVHARDFGNGGQVYSILRGSTLAHNISAVAINEPNIDLELGASYSPNASFYNSGESIETFKTYFRIEDSVGTIIYADTVLVSSLDIGATQEVQFSPDWVVPYYGVYKFITYLSLVGDEYLGDDTLSLIGRCMHDGALSSIYYPFDDATINTGLNPIALVKNNGTYTEDFQVFMSIKDSSGVNVYFDSVWTDSALIPGEKGQVSFSEFTPVDTGTYSLCAWVKVADDLNSANDSAYANTFVGYEILYDDGNKDIYGYVSPDFYDNKFALKFTPVIDTPYSVIRVRIWVNDTMPFILTINDDSIVSADTSVPSSLIFAGPNTIHPLSDGWVFKDYALAMSDTNAFWVVYHWLPSFTSSSYVGMDANYPHEARSWWYWSKPSDYGWHIGWGGDYDFMIRTLVAPGGGIPEIAVSPDSLYFYIGTAKAKAHILSQVEPAPTKISPDILEYKSLLLHQVEPAPTKISEVEPAKLSSRQDCITNSKLPRALAWGESKQNKRDRALAQNFGAPFSFPSQDTATMWVKNLGDATLTIPDITHTYSWITVISPSNFGVEPGDSMGVTVVVSSDGLPSGIYYDTLNIISNDSIYYEPVIFEFISGAEESENDLPFFYSLSRTQPNPFSTRATIRYAIPKKTRVKIGIYNISGQLIKVLVDEIVEPGNKVVVWDGSTQRGKEVSSGIYFVKLWADKFTATKKMIIVR